MKRCEEQTQKWFLCKARAEVEINLLNEVEQEFVDHKWVSFWFTLSHIVPFKEDVYAKVLNEFLPTYIAIAND